MAEAKGGLWIPDVAERDDRIELPPVPVLRQIAAMQAAGQPRGTGQRRTEAQKAKRAERRQQRAARRRSR